MSDPTNALIESLRYKNEDRVKRDVKFLITHYTDLRPKTGSHSFKNIGKKERAFYLKGTIPIVYKGNTYNIPIEIWVPENYPYGPPSCYVCPTTNMEIKTSTFVDRDGKIKLPYLKDWKNVEMDNLLKTEQRLNDGSVVIDNMIRVLGQEAAEVEVTCQELDRGVREAEKTLEKFGDQKGTNDDFQLDEAVVATTPLYRQILSSYAEENAIVDATYYLGEALKRGAIDLDLFLKNVRELSRKQFTLKLLMQKCRQRANLPI